MGTYNKIIINDEVILDLSSDTITTNKLLEGVTAHDATGMQITGKIKKYNKEYIGNLEILEPAAYSYNGTVLPKLPDWDKTTYPYAYIGGWPNTIGERQYYLFFTDEPFFLTSGVLYNTANGMVYIYDPRNTDLGWDFMGEYENQPTSGKTLPEVWANYDIYKENSETEFFLKATEPIPVYEWK